MVNTMYSTRSTKLIGAEPGNENINSPNANTPTLHAKITLASITNVKRTWPVELESQTITAIFSLELGFKVPIITSYLVLFILLFSRCSLNAYQGIYQHTTARSRRLQRLSQSCSSWQFWHTKSAVRPPCHTSVATSDFGDLLLISARPLYRYYTSRPQELALLIVLSVAQQPPFGTLWPLTLQVAVHWLCLNPGWRHTSSVRHLTSATSSVRQRHWSLSLSTYWRFTSHIIIIIIIYL